MLYASMPPPSNVFPESTTLSGQLTAQQIDIWEHAALLYHGYEWQAAADTFATLSAAIDDTERRMLCLLNAVLIQARLGDYDTAACILEEAARVGQSCLLITFLLGLFSYELRDLSKAEYCFELCLDALACGAVDYSDIGLDFVLDKALLYNNLRGVRSAQYSASFPKDTGSSLMPLDAVPAEGIFEAPPRSPSNAKVSDSQQQTQSTAFHKLFAKKTPLSPRSLASVKLWNNSMSLESPTSQLSFPSLSASERPNSYEGLASILEDVQAPTGSILASSAHESPIIPTSALSPIDHSNSRRSWRGRPPTPYTPRDARVGFDSTREMASFIRAGGRRKELLPRDAKGEYGSVKELSKFVQFYAPEKPRASTIPQPLDLDPNLIAELRMARVLCDAYDAPPAPCPTDVTPDTGISSLLSPVTHRYSSPDHFQLHSSSELEPSAPLLFANGDKASVKPLRPIIYNPWKGRRLREAVDLKDEPLVAPIEAHRSIPSTPPTSASSANSYLRTMPIAHRRTLARTRTLDMLEGRGDTDPPAPEDTHYDKPLPPCPDGGGSPKQSSSGGGTPDSVATLDFFERILGPGRRK